MTKSIHPTSSGGIPRRTSSLGSNGRTKNTKTGTRPRHIPPPLELVEEERPPFHLYQPAYQPCYHNNEEPTNQYRDNICHDIHHQEHEASHIARLEKLSRTPHPDRIRRAQNIFLRDPTARPILTLGRPTWSTPTLRENLYLSSLKSHTSKIHSPRTRTRFLDWQSEIDTQTHHCWHGIDTYDLNPLSRQARLELSTGLPTRIMPHHSSTLRLLTRRPTLDILTPSERTALIDWWEHHLNRKVLTPTARKFPWLRFGERHYLQRRAKQAEKDKNQKLYDLGLLSPGTAETLRERGKLRSDYAGRRRTGSLSLRREPTQESKMTVRTW